MLDSQQFAASIWTSSLSSSKSPSLSGLNSPYAQILRYESQVCLPYGVLPPLHGGRLGEMAPTVLPCQNSSLVADTVRSGSGFSRKQSCCFALSKMPNCWQSTWVGLCSSISPKIYLRGIPHTQSLTVHTGYVMVELSLHLYCSKSCSWPRGAESESELLRGFSVVIYQEEKADALWTASCLALFSSNF